MDFPGDLHWRWTFPVIITVNYLGSPDNGVIIAAYLGSWLMAGAYLAVSSMTSAMTRNQVISFILSVVICLFLVLCGYPPVTGLLMRLDRPWLVGLGVIVERDDSFPIIFRRPN